MHPIHIALDAADDLVMAGYPREEADDFSAAYRGAAAALEAALGLDIRVKVGSGDVVAGWETSTPIGGEDTLERVLWQAIHDMLTRDAGEPDGPWGFDGDAVHRAAAKLRPLVQRLSATA